MANWLTADELSRLFVVQAETLLAYSARGNLGSRLDVQGQRVFSRRQVETLFSRRGDNGLRVGAALGRLGQVRLEPNEAVRLTRRDDHRLKVQSGLQGLSKSA